CGVYRSALEIRFFYLANLRAHCRQQVRETEISSGFGIKKSTSGEVDNVKQPCPQQGKQRGYPP
ncbi:MAG: hypothetical protein FWG74_01030, partial [Planctomycetes bacterium]|nr:hypothetical protein [Planctomycetota bacterium]